MIALALMLAGATNDVIYVSGNKLYSWCSEEAGTPLASACTAYVDGVADSLQMEGVVHKTKLLCLNGQMPAGQIRDVAVKYLVDHPETRHLPAAALVRLALTQAFPCS